LPEDLWEWTEDAVETVERIRLACFDFSEIEASLSRGGRASRTDRQRIDWLAARVSEWNEPTQVLAEPIFVGFECNWQDADGTWLRAVHLVRSGRHRLLAAREQRLTEVWGIVGQRLFRPVGLRPPDRDLVPAGDRPAAAHAHIHRNSWIVSPDA
jgi:hypothetical protein